jgi:hypothetical protein
MKRAYILYHFGKEFRFVCLTCTRIEVEDNTIFIYLGENLIGQIDRGYVDIFYYTEPTP